MIVNIEITRWSMDLKERLRIAFIIMIAVPMLLFIISAKFITDYMGTSLREKYNVTDSTYTIMFNPISVFNHLTKKEYDRIRAVAVTIPEKFEDVNYLNELNDELADRYSFLIVRKGSSIAFSGDVIDNNVLASLPDFGCNMAYDGGIYIGGKTPVLIKQQDFIYSNGSEGSVFIVTNVNILIPQMKTSIIQAIICAIVIIFMTSVLLIAWLYHGILFPLNTLKKATHELTEGNLNYAITGDPKDEIGQLCRDFDEMRRKLKMLIEERMTYEQDSRELLISVSHDLKTPITTIKGYAEGLMDGIASTPEKKEKYIKTIYSKANDMSVLVDELLVFSRLDNNTVPYKFTNVEAGSFFNDCIEEIGMELEMKNISLTYKNELKKEIYVQVDIEQLKRVINNIIGNSVKYLDKPKGEFSVRLSSNGFFICAEFTDNGSGIDKKDLKYIFNKFYRTDSSRNSSTGGTGLGLAIVKKIIEAHGGTVSADSEIGKGTTISFTLPVGMERQIGMVTGR
jgi:signal transduction histidine kinase